MSWRKGEGNLISTVTTVTTVTATFAAGTVLGILATVLLISLLAAKEVVMADPRRAFRVLGKSLDVGIAPLLLAFMLAVAVKILEILA
jgi:hypothetical protein